MLLLANLILFMSGAVAQTSGSNEATANLSRRLDEAAAAFHGLSANLTRTMYAAVLNERSQDSGTFVVRLTKSHSMQLLIDFTLPDPKSVAFEDHKFRIFYPKMNAVDEYDLGKQGKLVDQFVLLGFGTPGRQLVRSYSVRVLGEESISGYKTTKAELVPKLEDVRRQVTKVEVWFAQSGSFPVQQKLFMPSGDYWLITYSDIKLNPTLAPDAARLKLPKGVHVNRR